MAAGRSTRARVSSTGWVSWRCRSVRCRPVRTQLVDIAGRKQVSAPASGSGLKLSVEQVWHCLAQLPPDRFDDYHDWLDVGMACHAATDGDPKAFSFLV